MAMHMTRNALGPRALTQAQANATAADDSPDQQILCKMQKR